jgi:hypothetical protein
MASGMIGALCNGTNMKKDILLEYQAFLSSPLLLFGSIIVEAQ